MWLSITTILPLLFSNLLLIYDWMLMDCELGFFWEVVKKCDLKLYHDFCLCVNIYFTISCGTFVLLMFSSLNILIYTRHPVFILFIDWHLLKLQALSFVIFSFHVGYYVYTNCRVSKYWRKQRQKCFHLISPDLMPDLTFISGDPAQIKLSAAPC